MQVAREGNNMGVLTPKLLRRMLFLPSTNNILKLLHANVFLYFQASSSNVLKDFVILFSKMPNNLSSIDISLLEE
jgi:hypothetical protein